MDYWSAPGTIASLNPWSIEVEVTDQNIQAGDNLVSPVKEFDVEETIQGNTDVNAFDWGSISITAQDVYANAVVVENEGTGQIDISVTGADVRGADFGTSGKAIPATRFEVDDSGSNCNSGNVLNDEVSSVSSDLSIVRGSSSTGNLYSCITQIDDLGLTAQVYTSRTDWLVDMS